MHKKVQMHKNELSASVLLGEYEQIQASVNDQKLRRAAQEKTEIIGNKVVRLWLFSLW